MRSIVKDKGLHGYYRLKKDDLIALLLEKSAEEIRDISKLLSTLNEKTLQAYHYCVNCLNGFRTSPARNKHYGYCSSNGHVKVKMPSEKEKWLKFHDGQYQFKVPFMLYADFESILEPVDERYKGI